MGEKGHYKKRVRERVTPAWGRGVKLKDENASTKISTGKKFKKKIKKEKANFGR